MRRKVFSSGLWVSLAALTVLLVSPAPAQQDPAPQDRAAPPTVISIAGDSLAPDVAEIGDLLRQGQRFEVERRWGEALTHYEDAVRQFPSDASLQRRYEFARLHYDVGRRYGDRSFSETLAKLTPEGALDLYAQVLLKIQSHYVEVPNWKLLVERGTANLEVALSEAVFLERNLPGQDRRTIDTFRRELHHVLGPRVIQSRSDARDAVAIAARLAEARLNLSPTAAVLEYLCGATNSLDPYSAYLTPDQLNEVYAQIEGNFIGLGIELKAEDGALLIVRVISGSPAQEAGILAGDRIVSIDGRPTRDLSTDEAANFLQGDEGSTVELTVVTPPQPSHRWEKNSPHRMGRQLSIRRRRVEVPSIDAVKILDPDHGIGYFQLACFQKTTCRDLEAALWKLHGEGMKALIIDLRGNPGGLLVTAVEVADKFIDRGIIVSTRGRSAQEDFTYSAHKAGTWRTPLVLLIDEDSASAAEILAGAIRDHHRGTIVGVRSYGKGSVQGIFPLDFSTAGVRLTTARFYSPTGRPYSRTGVEPDVTVHLTARPVAGRIVTTSIADDAMLSAALQAARRDQRPQ